MICLRASSDFKQLTKHENDALRGITAAPENLCDAPLTLHGMHKADLDASDFIF
jgi:hypothetical protein